MFKRLFAFKKENKNKREILLKNNTLIDNLLSSSFLSFEHISQESQRMIFKDLSFSQSHQSRRSVILAKELQIICENEEIKTNFLELFNPDLIGQILETYLYGLNVFEVNYKLKSGFYYPILKQRDFRNFSFNEEGELCFKGFGTEEVVEERKAIYGLFGSNFLQRNGDALLLKLFFPIKLKNASLKFWMEFLERFGSPWAVAKTDSDPDALASEVYSMLQGDSAVIDKEEELELIQPSTKANYNEIIDYLDNQIRSVILGANLSSQVSGGSLAAAESHNEIRKNLAEQDAKIVLFVLNRALKFFKEINGFKDELKVQFFSESNPKLDLCERDYKLYSMGFVFEEEYLKSTYNIQGSLQKAQVIEPKNPNNHFLNSNKPQNKDAIDKALEEEEFIEFLKETESKLDKSLTDFINNSTSYEELFEILLEKQPNLNKEKFEKLLINALNNSSILGISNDD
ncbi:hypothetical protein B6S12_10275 [Helicobacter valdiviensis]|uniref:DUF935 family protein n=1 Tax=Helicobacter valdiviensis TaxID=1458358 RepID=A0A2W6PKM3_9HELI|nr:DUF935 family protein [Helicobacter valdiviensis]PZT47213.1 hypothetical protein B6S12_10275 [Helicobacter valdiviensis]